MSEIDTAAVEAEAPPGKRSRRTLVIVAALVVLAGAGAAYTVLGGSAEEPAVPEDAAPTEGAVVPLEPMTASIGGATPGYVRVGLALVLAEGVDPAEISDRFALVQDAALSELSHYEPQRLRTPEGIAALRAALGERAREIYPDGEVVRVVFTELLVQ